MSDTVRVYQDGDGTNYFSVTTFIGKLMPFDNRKWYSICNYMGWDPEQIREVSTTLGTRYHAYFENRRWFDRKEVELFGEKVEATEYDFVASPLDIRYLRMANEFFDRGWEIIESEVKVVNTDLFYAGRFDMIMRNEKLGVERALGDVKTWGAWKESITGKAPSGFEVKEDKLKKLTVQLNMYRRALGERIPMYGIVPDPLGELRVFEVVEDETWLDEVAEARLEILKDIEEGTVVVNYEMLEAI